MEPVETTMKSLEELEKCFETDQAKSLMVFVDHVINTTVDHFAARIDQRFDAQDKNISMLKWVVGVGTAILLSLMAILLSLGIAGLA